MPVAVAVLAASPIGKRTKYAVTSRADFVELERIASFRMMHLATSTGHKVAVKSQIYETEMCVNAYANDDLKVEFVIFIFLSILY